jgi:hypothetical protein
LATCQLVQGDIGGADDEEEETLDQGRDGNGGASP